MNTIILHVLLLCLIFTSSIAVKQGRRYHQRNQHIVARSAKGSRKCKLQTNKVFLSSSCHLNLLDNARRLNNDGPARDPGM